MSVQIFEDENHNYRFDFTAAVWATDTLHDLFQNHHAQILSDVDFIAETDEDVILVEYKNASVPGAAKPEAFQPSKEKALHKIAYKYYDSWIYLKAIRQNKPVEYVYILEYPMGDSVSRGMIREKIVNLLPFQLQALPEIGGSVIKDFFVLSIEEWNRHPKYGAFPISQIAT